MNNKSKNLKMAAHRTQPDPFASSEEKGSEEYGLKFGKLIEHEWFFIKSGGTDSQFYDKQAKFHELRKYARGEHDTGLTKKLISDGVDGESYTNYDWRPIQILPKFIKLVVNQMLERLYEIDAQAIDGISQGLRDEYKDILQKNMVAKPMLEDAKNLLGIDLSPDGMGEIPDSNEELDLHMNLNYKPAIEVAIEQALKYTLELNEYDETQKMMLKDLTEIGVAALHHRTDPTKGIVAEYRDPADMVWSYPTRSNFENVYYYGSARRLTLNEVQRLSGKKFSQDELEKYANVSKEWGAYNKISNEFWYRGEDLTNYQVDVLDFTFKTTKLTKYKKKYKKNGGFSIIEKPSDYIKPQSILDKEEKQGFKEYDILENVDEVWYEGSLVIGTDLLFNYGECTNMLRPEGYINNKVMSNYVVYAPELYQGRIQSLVGRVTQYIDQLQQIQVKIQQFIAKAKPNGIWIDVDGLQELDMGEGNTFGPLELIRYYDETGNLLGTSKLADGNYNNGAMPIKELNNGGMAGLEQLMNSYNFHLNLFREAIGIGQGADGTLPDPRTSNGALEAQQNKSNVATRYILDAQLKITQYLANGLSLRLKDIFKYSNLKKAYINSIGKVNVDVLKSIQNLHLHDFGITIKLKPDAQDRAMLENNIQAEIAAGGLSTVDGIDIRRIGNITLANEMLKIRKKKNIEENHKRELEKIEANGEASARGAQAAAEAKQSEMSMEFDFKKQILLLERESAELRTNGELEAKRLLMADEYFYQTGIQAELDKNTKNLEKYKEDRKDERTKIQATQQSKIKSEQSKEGGGEAIDFRSGNTSITGDLGMDDFTA
ncbi:structural protein [Cellulophaga phage phi38:1]|uniref:Structural protein n=1 Tax=Cellulophaga phage phi38:1 TaxID=1327977 RepID=R9ZYC2_9CAUD|nr:portal protein [Cellulophaga phage phi38:1]AGO48121.1 structural protein [Cellulophaga phage phi38:1]